VCGQINGDIVTCDANNPRMSIHTMMSCRRSRGKFSDGTKVTGFAFVSKQALATNKRWSKQRQQILRDQQQQQQQQQSLTDLDAPSDPKTDFPGNQLTASIQRPRTLTSPLQSALHVSSTKNLHLLHAHTHGHLQALMTNVFQQYHLLVTTNDHRIRMLNLEDRSVVAKFKGHTNGNMQIRAGLSECMQYVICGSDDGLVHVWQTLPDAHGNSSNHDELSGNGQSGSAAKSRINAAAAATTNWLSSLFSGQASANAQKRENNRSDHFNPVGMQTHVRPSSSHSPEPTVNPCILADTLAGTITDTLANTLSSATSTVASTISSAQAVATNLAIFVPSNVLACACKHHSELQKLTDFPAFLETLNMANAVSSNAGSCRNSGNFSTHSSGTSSTNTQSNYGNNGMSGDPTSGSVPALFVSGLNSVVGMEVFSCVSKAILTCSTDGSIKIFVRGLR
jgi:hypothetical protein